MKLLLVRHGNTFGPGDRVVWVGANEDIPLVEKGEAQARALGEALRAAGIAPDAMVCGPLKRTRRAAELVMAELGLDGAPRVDERLREIDYGPWGGLDESEVAERFGPGAAAELNAWRTQSRWPTQTVTWRPGETAIIENVRALVGELEGELGPAGTAIVCSSNGILRYFLELTDDGLAAAVAKGTAKMGTGAASLLEVADGGARVLFWGLKAGERIPPFQ